MPRLKKVGRPKDIAKRKAIVREINWRYSEPRAYPPTESTLRRHHKTSGKIISDAFAMRFKQKIKGTRDQGHNLRKGQADGEKGRRIAHSK